MTHTFTVHGEPVGKGRPRFSRAGKFVHTYTPEKTRDYEQRVAQLYRVTIMLFVTGHETRCEKEEKEMDVLRNDITLSVLQSLKTDLDERIKIAEKWNRREGG